MAEYIEREALIATIRKELDQSSSTRYCCEDGTIICTDVGYVADWFQEYVEVLRRRNFAAAVQPIVEGASHDGEQAIQPFKETPLGDSESDVAPVVHGRWITDGLLTTCSICQRSFNILPMFAHYCPNCGCKMDGE